MISGPTAQPGSSALDALLDAAARILAADSLRETLGQIVEHLRGLLPYDDLTVYEMEPGGQFLRPVFAVGNWVEEIMADRLDVGSGITGWVVRNRRTRNVPNTLLDPICTTVPGTEEEAEAFVCVPLLAHDRDRPAVGERRPQPLVAGAVVEQPGQPVTLDLLAQGLALARRVVGQRRHRREPLDELDLRA